jgi:hypothetical protein
MLGRSLLIKASGASVGYDDYVQDYLNRVTAADVAAGNTQGLESGVADAFNVVIRGLVADGILGVSGGVISQAASKIKAMCFMCGARTLSGCLVPVVGPAPTNFNFVSGDYNRKTGLLGNGSTKYLNPNRNNNADPQNNKHISVFASSFGTIFPGRFIAGGNSAGAGDSIISLAGPSSVFVSINTNGVDTPAAAAGFLGASRSSAASFLFRGIGVNTSYNKTSGWPTDINYGVFADASGSNAHNCRLSFYSMGESLGLAVLDARISTLMATLASAIP